MYEDVVRENCGVSPELDRLAVWPTWSNETEYRKERYLKSAGRGADSELKGPQKRASEIAKTATESKLEPAPCSLQSAETDQNSQMEILTAHCSRGLVSANAVFRKCALNNINMDLIRIPVTSNLTPNLVFRHFRENQ